MPGLNDRKERMEFIAADRHEIEGLQRLLLWKEHLHKRSFPPSISSPVFQLEWPKKEEEPSCE